MESPGGGFRMFLGDTLFTIVLRHYHLSGVSSKTTSSNQRLTGRAFTRYVTSEKRMRSGGYLALSRLCLRVWWIFNNGGWFKKGVTYCQPNQSSKFLRFLRMFKVHYTQKSPVESFHLGTMESPGGGFRMFLRGTLSTTVLRHYHLSRISSKTTSSNQRFWEGIYQICHLWKEDEIWRLPVPFQALSKSIVDIQ